MDGIGHVSHLSLVEVALGFGMLATWATHGDRRLVSQSSAWRAREQYALRARESLWPTVCEVAQELRSRVSKL